jgi:hypothetical protein
MGVRVKDYSFFRLIYISFKVGFEGYKLFSSINNIDENGT